MKLYDLLQYATEKYGQQVALIHGELRVTYSRLDVLATQIARFLETADLSKGDRVALMSENSLMYVASFFGIMKAGFVVVPIDTSLQPEKVRYILDDCGAKVFLTQTRFARYLPKILTRNGTDESMALKLVVTDKPLFKMTLPVASADFADIFQTEPHRDSEQSSLETTRSTDEHVRMLKEVVSSAPHELAAIFYTSGSTGSPRGVMLSHRNLLSNTIGTVEYLQLTEKDKVMVVLPFYYIYGNSLLLTHVAVGGTVVIDNRFTYPEAILDTMEREEVTGFSGVPSNFMLLLHNSTFAKRTLPSLRYFTQAGGAMAPEVIRRLIDSFPDKQIFIMYGQTEASPRVSWLPPDKLREKLGSVGIPVPGVIVKIVNPKGEEVGVDEEGEIIVGGDSVMMGYWNDPDEQSEVLRDGWLYTGDLAKKDSDGFIFIVGRKKEIIKSGGHRVSAKEIEEYLLEHEQIVEAAVFGVKDPILGEAIKATVVVKSGVPLEAKDIQDFCKRSLPVYKVPRYIEFMDSLPKYESGKVNKLELKKRPVS